MWRWTSWHADSCASLCVVLAPQLAAAVPAAAAVQQQQWQRPGTGGDGRSRAAARVGDGSSSSSSGGGSSDVRRSAEQLQQALLPLPAPAAQTTACMLLLACCLWLCCRFSRTAAKRRANIFRCQICESVLRWVFSLIYPLEARRASGVMPRSCAPAGYFSERVLCVGFEQKSMEGPPVTGGM